MTGCCEANRRRAKSSTVSSGAGAIRRSRSPLRHRERGHWRAAERHLSKPALGASVAPIGAGPKADSVRPRTNTTVVSFRRLVGEAGNCRHHAQPVRPKLGRARPQQDRWRAPLAWSAKSDWPLSGLISVLPSKRRLESMAPFPLHPRGCRPCSALSTCSGGSYSVQRRFVRIGSIPSSNRVILFGARSGPAWEIGQ